MGMILSIQPGATGSASLTVADEHTAARVGSGKIGVLATPVLINLFEAAALAACEAQLPGGHQSLGTRLDVSHTAATLIGMKVTATARVTAVEGRTIRFALEARDDVEVIGQGTHERVVVSVARFDVRVTEKKLRAGLA
jgi:predicted thioesterase